MVVDSKVLIKCMKTFPLHFHMTKSCYSLVLSYCCNSIKFEYIIHACIGNWKKDSPNGAGSSYVTFIVNLFLCDCFKVYNIQSPFQLERCGWEVLVHSPYMHTIFCFFLVAMLGLKLVC